MSRLLGAMKDAATSLMARPSAESGAHLFVGGQRLHHGGGHLALQVGEAHRRVVVICAASASSLACAVQIALGLLRLGVDFVEAGNVVVPLEQRGRGAAALDGARVEFPDRIDHRMIVRVENVLLVSEWPAM